MGDEELEVVVAEDVVLRQPLGQQHVRRQPLHRLSLPLPDDALLQAAENFSEMLDGCWYIGRKIGRAYVQPLPKGPCKVLTHLINSI